MDANLETLRSIFGQDPEGQQIIRFYEDMVRFLNQFKDIVNKPLLHVIQVEDISTPPENWDFCSICIEKELEKQICKVKCGHVFHMECLNQWISMSKDTCPLCRFKL